MMESVANFAWSQICRGPKQEKSIKPGRLIVFLFGWEQIIFGPGQNVLLQLIIIEKAHEFVVVFFADIEYFYGVDITAARFLQSAPDDFTHFFAV